MTFFIIIYIFNTYLLVLFLTMMPALALALALANLF